MQPLRSGGTALPLDEHLGLDAILEDAFAPLRLTGASLSPARVRAAVRWAPATPPPLRGAALLGRAGELATAVAVAALVFAASLAPLGAAGPVSSAGGWTELTAPSTAVADEVPVAPGLSLDRPETFIRRLRDGRTAAANDLIDPLLGAGGVGSPAAADGPADMLYRVRQGLAR